MTSKKIDKNEEARLTSLYALNVLDSNPEAVFDGLVEIAADVCSVPISLISLIDENRQWFKANTGLQDVAQTSRDVAFCSHAIEHTEDLLEIKDATTDSRFSQNPLVTGEPNIRFYAGAKLTLSDGATVGTLCIIDSKPKALTDAQRMVLLNLARAAVNLLEARLLAEKLATSESRLRSLCDASPLGIFSSNSKGACNYINNQCLEMLGLTEEQALGWGWRDRLHTEDSNKVLTALEKMLFEQHIFDHEFRIVRSCGSVKHVRVIAVPTYTADGTLSGSIGVFEDTTQRIVENIMLAEERSRLESIINGTGAGTWEWNIQTDEFRPSQRFRDISGNPSKLFTTVAETRDLIHPDDLERSDAELQKHLNGDSERYGFERRLKHPDGSWGWVFDCGQIVTYTSDGKPEWMFGTRVDINERKLQAKQLSTAQEQAATDQRRNALTQQRLSLARDMHDTLAHSLMALLTQIRVVRKLRNTLPEDELEGELESLELVAVSGIAEARAAIKQMRHNDVKDIGLGGAIQSLCDRFTENTGISARIRIDEQESIAVQAHAETLFRITEEALHNVERHSKANKVSIQLTRLSQQPCKEETHRFRLCVTDNGAGFNPTESRPGHYGIRGMEEQAALMEGEFMVRSKPDSGTTVRIEFFA